MTRASKQLGLAQPSLSKQLSSLEESVGARLFERAHKRMVLTDAGRLLLFHAQRVIRGIDEAEAGLREFTSGKRAVIRIAGLNSVIRAIVPDALQRCGGAASGIEVDIHEAAPGEVVDMLYARQAHIGLIADGTVAKASIGFRQIPIVEDPYVFAVPSTIDLARLQASMTRPLTSCACSTTASSSISALSIRCASSSGTSTSCHRIVWSRIAAPTRWRSGSCARDLA